MGNQLTPNNSMILEIRELLENARKNVAQQVNTQLLTTYWNIGRIIVGFNTGLIVCGVTGVLPPTTSALLHNTSTLVIGLQSMKNLLDESE